LTDEAEFGEGQLKFDALYRTLSFSKATPLNSHEQQHDETSSQAKQT